jgi:2'-5' RNA ligase
MHLAALIETSCEQIGYPRERRPYRAHLTLARIDGRAPAGLREYVEANQQRPLGTLHVDRVVLYQSELAPGGSRYTPLATWLLEAVGRS